MFKNNILQFFIFFCFCSIYCQAETIYAEGRNDFTRSVRAVQATSVDIDEFIKKVLDLVKPDLVETASASTDGSAQTEDETYKIEFVNRLQGDLSTLEIIGESTSYDIGTGGIDLFASMQFGQIVLSQAVNVYGETNYTGTGIVEFTNMQFVANWTYYQTTDPTTGIPKTSLQQQSLQHIGSENKTLTLQINGLDDEDLLEEIHDVVLEDDYWRMIMYLVRTTNDRLFYNSLDLNFDNFLH